MKLPPFHPLLAATLLAAPAFAQFDPPIAVDINPDPDIVEINLTASVTTHQFTPGVDTTVWAYNGTVPGPTIEAKVGDTIIVHFTNNLPEATTIHWHGMEIPADMDGSHIAQAPTPPGGTFDYQFKATRGSLYWYHPHVRPFDQVEKGLYGAVLIHEPLKEAMLGLDALDEHVVIFDDILLDANNQVVPAFSFTDPLQNALYHVNGREGNLLLVNGKRADTVTLDVTNGRPQRWRVVNVANTTFCRLDINDAIEGWNVQLWELGTDGGLEETPYPRAPVVPFTPTRHPTFSLIGPMGQGIFLLPGERLDVVFTPIGADQELFRIFQHDWIRGRHIATYGPNGEVLLPDDPSDGFHPKQPYFQVRLNGPDPGTGEFTPPANLLTTIAPPTTFAGTLKAHMGHSPPDTAGNITMFVQADFSTGTMVPLPTPKIDSFNAQDVNVGEDWMWEVVNLTHGDHPFHVHGFFFVPLEYEFQDDVDPAGNFKFVAGRRMLKDTIRAPARGGAKGTTRTITRLATSFRPGLRGGSVVAQGAEATFDPSGSWTSGGWLFHCHILEHSGKGMLSFYEVHDPAEKFTLLGKHLAGTNGNPSLTATGDLSPGSTVTIDVVNAIPNFVVGLVGGTSVFGSPINLPFKGGTIVPAIETILVQPTDANGRATFTVTGWDSAPSGTEIYVQAGFPDPGGPQGWAFSNAVRWVVP